MSNSALFALFTILFASVLVQIAQSGAGNAALPATPHQEQAAEGMGTGEDAQPTGEAKTLQDAAGHPAQASPHQAEALDEISMRFRHLDQDQDGQVSQEEAKAEFDLAKNWAWLDDNGDGKLNTTEYRKRTIPSHQMR